MIVMPAPSRSTIHPKNVPNTPPTWNSVAIMIATPKEKPISRRCVESQLDIR